MPLPTPTDPTGEFLVDALGAVAGAGATTISLDILQFNMSGEATPDKDRPFACDQCDERFETHEELDDHVWEYHEMDGDVTTEVTDES